MNCVAVLLRQRIDSGNAQKHISFGHSIQDEKGASQFWDSLLLCSLLDKYTFGQAKPDPGTQKETRSFIKAGGTNAYVWES